MEVLVLVPVMIVVVPMIEKPVGDTPEAVSAACSVTVRCWGDTVAKVFLRGGTQILRPVDAAIE